MHQAWENTLHWLQSWTQKLGSSFQREDSAWQLHITDAVQQENGYPTVLCSDQKNILSERWTAKSDNRLRKRFFMITEHKSQLEYNRRLKHMKWTGKQRMNFTSWQSSILTGCAKAETDISNTTARMTVLEMKEKSIQKSLLKFLRQKNSSNTRKALQHFQLQGQTDWFVIEKQRGISAYCKKRYTLDPRNSCRCYDTLTHKSYTPGTTENTRFSFPWLRLQPHHLNLIF